MKEVIDDYLDGKFDWLDNISIEEKLSYAKASLEKIKPFLIDKVMF